MTRLGALFLTFVLALLTPVPSAVAGEPAIPNYWDARERLPKPDLSAVERIRFLTTIDFPPFSFLDPDGRLSGFHVELVRAICRELDIVPQCQIQALPWAELEGAMAAGQAEALVAGTAITGEARERYVFSRPYLRFPARFVAPRSTTMAEPMHKAAAGRRIGVLGGTVHETMLRSYFPAAKAVVYTRPNWLMDDLREGKIDAVFGDGMRLSFWIAGVGSGNCCAFAGGPYIAPELLGAGLAIAALRDDAILAQAFDYALREISVSGTFAELYLRYFPVSFY